jgi:hypothetical protein
MEAIYFGICDWWGEGTGDGPWVMADLENGLFAGQDKETNPNSTPLNYTYVTAMVKGKPGGFCIKGGNAQSGILKTMYEGGRPTLWGYDPMKKEGAIILGIGGDNSNGAVGTFYEGAITTGYSTDAIDNAIQENIIAAGYGSGTGPASTPTIAPGSLGDTNGDGSIDIVDALLIAQYYVDLNPSGFIPGNADTNCDGAIGILDALLVAQYYVGLISEFC